MKLYNPAESDIKIMFRGVEYEIKALSSKELPDVVAKHWKDNIHQFLKVDGEKLAPITEETEEVVKETIKKVKSK